jgi:predicted transcriptional regulator
MVKKRERFEIIRDILSAIKDSRSIKPTRLLYASNLSPQMFKDYIGELKEKNLIKEEQLKTGKFFALTLKGITFLEEYQTFSKFIRNFGL